MWIELSNEVEISKFMEDMDYFHDSCLKELMYISGAYVDKDLSMYPINEKKILRVVIQRQNENNPMVELEFIGMKCLKVFPIDDNYTCEIFDSTMFIKNNNIYWVDCGSVSEKDLENYDGTIICASRVRWRSISGCMGEEPFYTSLV